MSTKKISVVEILLWILVILLIFISLTPLALGFKVKSDYQALIGLVSDMYGVDIKLEDYNQGYFSSDARLAVTSADFPEPVYFQEQIIHGPVYLGLIKQGKSPLAAAVVQGELIMSDNQQMMARKVFANDKPVQYQSIIDFSGDIEAQVYVPSINTQFDTETGPVSIQSSGLILNQTYTAATGELKGDAQIQTFKVDSDGLLFKTDSMTMSFTGKMGNNQIMLGDSVASIGRLNIDSGFNQFSMRDMTIRSLTSEQGALINSGAQIQAREILASNQKYGPVKFNISVNGLNANSLSQLQELQKTMAEQIRQGLPEEQASAMMMGQMMGLIPELIRQAQIKVNPLSVESELGKLEADLDFMLEGIDQNTPADPMFLMTAIKLDVNMSIDEQLLQHFIELQLMAAAPGAVNGLSSEDLEQQVNENIQGLMSENWLVLSDGTYISKISMQQGQMLINDMAVDPMQQLMSSMNNAPAQ